MQISAANLLLAGGQPHAADGGRVAGDAFARALGQGGPKPGTAMPEPVKQGMPAPFTPPDFAAQAAAAPPPPAATPAGAIARPGSRLDIRV